ncbi:MAG: flagellar motor protein MotB [Oscillospiraceae bacterium]|nr:flagellar motor protein MotB [Oscillospiraceae bacterium]
MARKKKETPPAKTDGWLNTYADMVTLLLCFFVLMYTASVPDDAKMQWILQSFSSLKGNLVNPVAVEPDPISKTDEEESPNPGPDEDDHREGDIFGIPGDMPMTFDDLFNWVSTEIDKADLDGAVSVGMSQGKLYIRFNDDIMFAPDSYELLPSGRAALNVIYPGIKLMNDYIATVEVAGHTAAVPQGQRSGVNDWFLSGQRAITVTNYLDMWAKMVDSDKFQLSGYGQYHPYLSNESEDTRAKNRRVELVITRNDFEVERTAEVIDILAYDHELGVTPGGNLHPTPPDHNRAGQVRRGLLEKYDVTEEEFESGGRNPNTDISEWGPTIRGIPTLPDRPDAAADE